MRKGIAMKRRTVIAALLCVPLVAGAQFSRVGTSAAQFLKFPAHPRTAALGGASAASYGQVESMFWNPAGIAGIQGVGATFSHASLFAGISYNFAGATIAIGGAHNLGIQAFYLDSGEMEQTTVQDPEGTGSNFSVRSYSFGITYAQYMTEWLMAGISLRYLREDLWNETAQSVGVDIGSVLETGFYGVRLGISIDNFGPDMQLSGEDLKYTYESDRVSIERGASLTTEPWPLPLTFRLGIAFDIVGGSNTIVESASHTVTAMGDYNEPNDAGPRANFGLEYGWEKTVFARLGYYQNYDALQFSYGLGVAVGGSSLRVAVDYALVDYRTLGYVHQYSIGVYF
jgi:hypothetical protein